MPDDARRIANFIIGGTEKAGTTSVFSYLSEHPQVCGSMVKETDFFRSGFSGDREADLAAYARYFARARADQPVVMEASPGYLGSAAEVAPRIALLAPATKLLFILREPTDRLHSSYQFHRSKLNISADLGFEEYVRRCLSFDHGEAGSDQLGIDEWYLKVLRFGCYSDFLEIYFAHLPRPSIRIMFFEHLRENERAFMQELSDFLGIERGFWQDYDFRPVNVTFSSRSKLLHRAAIRLNDRTEHLLRQRPRLRRLLVSAYKALNQARAGYDPMPGDGATREELARYYRPSVQRLQGMIDGELPASWVEAMRPRRADGIVDQGGMPLDTPARTVSKG